LTAPFLWDLDSAVMTALSYFQAPEAVKEFLWK
jgi:hypothetical protein